MENPSPSFDFFSHIPTNSNQKESKSLKGILKPKNSLQKNNPHRRISWGAIRQRNFLKNEESFFDLDQQEEHKKIPELSSSPFVLKQDESFFQNPCQNLENFEETQIFSQEDGEKPGNIQENQENREDFQISLGNMLENESFSGISNGNLKEIEVFPQNSERIINEDELFQKPSEVLQENPAFCGEDAKKPEELGQNADISFEIRHILTDLQEKSNNTSNSETFAQETQENKPKKRRLSDALNSLNCFTPESANSPGLSLEAQKNMPEIIETVINSMKKEAIFSNSCANSAQIQENIGKIASAHKHTAFDNDLAVIYKSTDNRFERKPEENRDCLTFTPKDVKNTFSPGTIKYIENQSSKLSWESERSENKPTNLSKMSLSPGSLLEELEFEGRNTGNREIVQENSEKFEDFLENREKFKSRLTEFGVKNILSVIEENSNEKNEESCFEKQKSSFSLENCANSGENKENCCENSVSLSENAAFSGKTLRNSLEIAEKSETSVRKSVCFVEEQPELSTNSLQKKKKYQKTPIINKIRKRTYQEIEKEANFRDFPRFDEDKRRRSGENQRILFNNFKENDKISGENEKIREKNEIFSIKYQKNDNSPQNMQKLNKNKAIIENSPLNAAQKNKLIEILHSNCKKNENNLENLIKSLLNSNNNETFIENDMSLMEVLRRILRKKMEKAQQLSSELAEKRKKLIKIQTKNDDLQRKLIEKKEKASEISEKIRTFPKKQHNILQIKRLNSQYFAVFGVKITEISESSSQKSIKFTLFDNECMNYFVDLDTKTLNFLRFRSKFARFDENSRFFLENSKNFESLIAKRIKSEKESNLLKNCYEIINKIAFFLNSFAIFAKNIETIRKDYNFASIEVKDEFLVSLKVKYCNFDEKFIDFTVNLWEWSNEIRMDLVTKEKFSEKMRNQINTIYNAEITRFGIHKLEKILEKVFSLKMKLRN